MVTDEVVTVATVDLTQAKLPQLIKWGIESGLVPKAEIGNVKFTATAAQGAISGLVDSGVQRITIFLQISDLSTEPSIWVATISNSANQEEALEALSSVADMLPIRSKALVLRGEMVVGAPDKETAQQWAADTLPRPEFSAVWRELTTHQVGVAVMGNADTRRVVRELLPQLPAPFEEATGELVADRVRWGGVQIDLPPKADAKVVVHSTDSESAQVCQRLVSAIMEYSVDQAHAEFRETAGQMILDQLKPTVDDKRVLIDLNPFLNKERLVPLVTAVRGLNAGPQRQNNLKQVMLGLLNYESAKQSFPQNAIYSDAGRPLLSWRVAILPYLGEQELYKKFRLDEPWDSPHNRRVSRDMPECYSDPENEHHNVNWRTMVQVPFGERMLFQGKEATKFIDVKDGSSNTIALVYTNPSKAVYWTKPSDWEVDLNNPLDGLKRDGDQTAVVAFADSSVHIISVDMPKQDWKALLTRDGGEVVNR
jgi:hypothetical protein